MDRAAIGSNSAYLPLERVLEGLGIEVDLPEYLPHRFEFLFIEPDEPTEYAPVTSWFGGGDDIFHIRVKRISIDQTVSASERNDDAPAEPYKGKYDFFIQSNIDRMLATWHQDNTYELSIHGNITHDELLQILNSIK